MPVIGPSHNERIACRGCGFDVTDLLLAYPRGFEMAVLAALSVGMPCCTHTPTLGETKEWARVAYAS